MEIVKGIKGGFEGLKRIFGSQDDDAAEEANDLRHAATPPSLPETHTWDPASPSQPRNTASVDLNQGPYQDDDLPDTSKRRLARQGRDGLRRTSEATPVPNPALGFRVAMTKPGSSNAFRPLDTLMGGSIADRINPARVQRHTTYAKHDRNPKMNSAQRHARQEATLAQRQSPETVAPPAKRRKTGNPNAAPRETIELGDSDNETRSAVLTRQTPTLQHPSNITSHSPHSATSRQSGRSPNRASQPVSEFLTTSDSLIPKRAKPRRKGANGHEASRRSSHPEVPFLGAGNQPQHQSSTVVNDNIQTPGHARSLILQSHEQGVDHEPSRNRKQRYTGLTSNHFRSDNSQMRINDSTARESVVQYNRIARGQQGSNGSRKNLREHRHAEQFSTFAQDPLVESEDELAQPTSKLSGSKRRQSSFKASAKSDLGHQSVAIDRCYRLKYARTYNVNVNSEDLQLRHVKADPKLFRITNLNSAGDIQTLETIDFSHVTNTYFDNLERIRLVGSLINGSRYWFDLQFANTQEFKMCRDTYVLPQCLKNKEMTDKLMVDLFQKPLQRNDKIGKSPMLRELPQTDLEHDRQPTAVKPTILGVLKNSARDSEQSTWDRSRQRAIATQAPLRPVRPTRATAQIHDSEVCKEKQPEKYSQIHGLGRPWVKPLDYSDDRGFLKRRKATIEFDDLEKLDEGEFLNDSLMNFYMLYLYKALNVSPDRVYFFNTYFYPTLTKRAKGQQGINYDDVKSWTKRDDVFSYDYLIIPINENLHWYLGLICNVNNIRRKPEHEALQDDSEDLLQERDAPHTSEIPMVSDGVADVTSQSKVSAETIMPNDAPGIDTADTDDVNLFEEEKDLNLIDRNAKAVDGQEQLIDEQGVFHGTSIEDHTGLETPTSTEATGASSRVASNQAKQASRKKTKSSSQPPKKDPDKPVIMILDSLSGSHPNATRALRQWLEAEGVAKRGIQVEIDNKGHYPKESQIPMQENFFDCGLYVLGYVRKFFEDPDEFRTKLLRQQMSARSDWPDMNPSEMRVDIRNLIFRLNDDRNGARKEAHKAKQTANGRDGLTSPTTTSCKEIRSGLKQANTTNDQTSATAPTVTTEPAPISTASTNRAPATLSGTPRPGSPIGSEARTERILPPTTGTVRTDDSTHASRTAQISSSASPGLSEWATQSPNKRTKSPEVRVSARSPHVSRATYELFDVASSRASRSRPQPADSASFLQNRNLHSKEDGNLRWPPARKTKASMPAGPSRERPTRASPPQARSVSQDDPVMLDDSQDLDAPIKKASQSARKPRSETVELDCSQDSVQILTRHVQKRTQSSPIQHRRPHQQHLNRDDSIREVARHEWEENRDITYALKKSLIESERPARLTSHRQYESDHPMEDAVDTQTACFQSSHTVQEISETRKAKPTEVDDDDRVIAESPEHRRSSPPPDVEMLD